MSQYLPNSGFKWLNRKEIDKFCLNSIDKNSSIGYILEVDLEYPGELHELHNNYLLTLEKQEISRNMLSSYFSNIANEYGIKIGGVNKLVPNLGNKSEYVLHYINLQLYLPVGMKLTKVQKLLKFEEYDRLKKYSEKKREKKYREKKKNAANSFEKDFFKLMNNSVYGRTMENLRKRINVRLVNNTKHYKKYKSKPSFVSRKTFNQYFVAIHEIKPVLTLDKPVYVGFCVLD